MATKVTFIIGEGYIADLARRMKRHRISQNALAREMGVTSTAASRWFTKNLERRTTPEMRTVQRIELALVRLRARKQRRAR